MTFEKTFTHTDGRSFRHVGTAPHVTCDGRSITLQIWHTCCLRPGCAANLEVRTATDTPHVWRSFKPIMYCSVHRRAARRESVTARKQGLKAWIATPEGQESLSNRLGAVERVVMGAVETLLLLDETADVTEVLDLTMSQLKAPAGGKRDTRRFRAMRALHFLLGKEKLHAGRNRVGVGPHPRRE